MTPFLWSPCWPIWRHVKHAAGHYHAHRISHAVKRAGRIAATKPAIVGWACLSVIGAAIVPPLFFWPSAVPRQVEASVGPVTYLPPEALPELLPGALYLPPLSLSPEIEIIGPVILLSELPQETAPGEVVPETPSAVPEPSSIGLLATAVAALAIIRGRHLL